MFGRRDQASVLPLVIPATRTATTKNGGRTMAITTVTTFKIDLDQAVRLAGQAAPMLRRHGASAIRIGLCHSGAHTGKVSVVITYPDWQTYGKAAQGMYEDQAYQSLFKEVLKIGELVDRSIMVVQDL
jgi:hypothetical protein